MINGNKFEDLTVKEIQTICDNSDECQGCPFNIGVGNCCCVFAYSPTEWVYEDKTTEWLKKVKSLIVDADSILYSSLGNVLLMYNKDGDELARFKKFPKELEWFYNDVAKLDDLIRED